MKEHHVSYRYNTYTDVLLAVGTGGLVERLYGLSATEIELHAEPDGFHVRYPAGAEVHSHNPFFEVKDKEGRETQTPNVLDRTPYGPKDPKPAWWGTTSIINTLASPTFNNTIAQRYTPELGQRLLEGEAEVKTGSMSQLLYAQASKGVNRPNLSTSQGNLSGDAEQVLALLGYQQGGAGFMRDPYTFSIIPRPREITLQGYRSLVEGFLRGYAPKASSGKTLPTREQTVPFFIAMAYFDFIIELFNYRDTDDPTGGYFDVGVGRIVAGLDRVLYYSMGTSSAPFLMDTLVIPEWLDRKSIAVNVRDVLRQTLGEHLDPNLLYLPVRAFSEEDPRHLVKFYRHYNPLRERRKLLTQEALQYVMEKTGYEDLNSTAMQRFARAVRSRTLTKLYREGDEPPDYELLTRLRSASLANDRLVNMLSAFVGSYNLRNARQTAVGKKPDGPNLAYEDLLEIERLIEKYGAEFIVNTLLAQAMSKRSEDEARAADGGNADAAPVDQP